MTNPNDLKNIGLKATYPRLKILDLFHKLQDEGSPRHVTAEDVYRHLLADDLDIGLATVYRVLTQFEQAGLLQRHHFESGKAIFELNEGKHHDHLVCVECGRVEEFFDAAIEKPANQDRGGTGLFGPRPRAVSLRRVQQSGLSAQEIRHLDRGLEAFFTSTTLVASLRSATRHNCCPSCSPPAAQALPIIAGIFVATVLNHAWPVRSASGWLN